MSEKRGVFGSFSPKSVIFVVFPIYDWQGSFKTQ